MTCITQRAMRSRGDRALLLSRFLLIAYPTRSPQNRNRPQQSQQQQEQPSGAREVEKLVDV